MSLIFKAPLSKMRSQIGDPITYQLGEINLNALLGKQISIRYLNEIHCIQCQRKTGKSFQGFCFPCFRRLQECGLCMIHPGRCRYPEGQCDENDWVHAACGQPHLVYLSNTAHVKVGITRKTQAPTRWIDQGAIQALSFFEVPNRYLAGQVEVMLKPFFPDKTPWQAMLKNQVQPQDMYALREEFLVEKSEEIRRMINVLEGNIKVSSEKIVTCLNYPVITYPTTIKAFNFDKTPHVEGQLLGIKGQYLLMDSGVLNIRKFSGYWVEIDAQAI